MTEIMVSVSCITYNQEDYIEEAIKSFLMQKTNFKIEILIHDDASTDRTGEIIKRYQEKYPDIIKPIIQKENQYSKGIKRISSLYNNSRAKGKYIALCEGDDYWTDPYKIQKQVDYMEENPDCTLSAHAVKRMDIQGNQVGEIHPYSKNTVCPIEDVILGGGGFFGTVSLLYPRELIKNPPSFYLDSPVGDYPLQIILASKGYAYYHKEMMAVYRDGVKGSWTKRLLKSNHADNNMIKHLDEIIEMLTAFNIYTEDKYWDSVKEKISKYEFDQLLIQNKIQEIKNNRHYMQLELLDKIKINTRYYLPNMHRAIAKLKSRGLKHD